MVLGSVFVVCLVMSSCGQEYYVDGRSLPPSGVLNRVVIAQQTPSALPFVDAYYDIRHAYSASSGSFSISGYSGNGPLTIENMPEQLGGAVYGEFDGSFDLISYAQEKVSTPISVAGGLSSTTEDSPYNGIMMTRDLNYVYAANPSSHLVSVVNRSGGVSLTLNLPNAYGISVNPGGTVALVFVENAMQAQNDSDKPSVNPGLNPATFAVYSVVQLTAAQQTLATNNPNYVDPTYGTEAQDCEPQKLPTWCIFPVGTGSGASFDHPIKAVFSPDGTTAYVLNCGTECGGKTASITTIPITASALNTGSYGGSGIALRAQTTIPIPGGATDADFNGNTLYITGQQLQTTGAYAGDYAGVLTVVNTPANSVAGTYSISDGTHNRMVFGDDNTLWIGSSHCAQGVRYAEVQAGTNVQFGCLTMFNTSTNAVYVDPYIGDATGIAAVTGLHKIYTAEGGQVYIYSTIPASGGLVQLDNSNVTVTGTATDVAYMDATSDADNTIY